MASDLDPDAEPAQNQDSGKPDEVKLQKSVVAARKVIELQDAASSLKEKAKNAVNPQERMRLLREAYDKEVEAWGQSKYAKRLQSGAWQGGVAGGGIGGAVAMGLGGLIGTLVTGIVSIPTVVVGGLVGAGVGVLHGPFLEFGKDDDKKSTMNEEQARSAAMEEAERLDRAVEQGASAEPRPPQFEGPATSPDLAQPAPKRKPKKLEMRTTSQVASAPEKKKPRKLETRHAAERFESV